MGGDAAGNGDGVREFRGEHSFAIHVPAHYAALAVTHNVIGIALADACR
jgi:hypothetical protein